MNVPKYTVVEIIELLNLAFNYEGDVFGVAHNLAMDVLIDLECLVEDSLEELL